jgi:hypothetical protein
MAGKPTESIEEELAGSAATRDAATKMIARAEKRAGAPTGDMTVLANREPLRLCCLPDVTRLWLRTI